MKALGRYTSSKWAAIAKCSPDTALRDITDLLVRGALRKSDAGGRSTRYELASNSGVHKLPRAATAPAVTAP